jgi:hypothetical protein
MNRDLLRQIVVILAVAATIIFNGMANALPLGGQTTGEISAQFQVYFVPAGYVFSIWGLIYLGLVFFAVYQALPSQRDNPRLGRIGYLFVFSCLANIAWLFLWHYQLFVLSLLAMVTLLLLLIFIYLRLEIGRAAVPAGEKWLVRLPFSIYLGWISVATIANASSVLDYIEWGGWGISPEIWTVIMLLVGVGLAAVMLFKRGDIAFALVFIWAFVGIAIRNREIPVVAVAAWTAAGLVVFIVAVAVIWRKGRVRELANN